ncbi:YqaI family protein [Bacillus badius]|uniref:Uncharacterized protein n=1 Tax=Bacillus badius TaxID=1455 RepID=A0ABR5B142_BACBA|nr:hypothetical protein [Bacillus badius]KIL80702.1 hypothetical protein SD77_0550 [Bacillus badius]MED4715369.1 hypothetical protein [Bacillus badius]
MNIEKVTDHPIEDLFGEEICTKDLYFIMPGGEIVLSHNLGDYMVTHLGAIEKQAK